MNSFLRQERQIFWGGWACFLLFVEGKENVYRTCTTTVLLIISLEKRWPLWNILIITVCVMSNIGEYASSTRLLSLFQSLYDRVKRHVDDKDTRYEHVAFYLTSNIWFNLCIFAERKVQSAEQQLQARYSYFEKGCRKESARDKTER